MKKLCHSIQRPMKISLIHTGSEGRIVLYVVNCAFYPPQTSDHLEFTHVILLIGRVSLTDFCFSEDLSHANIHTQTLCSFLHESIIGGIGSGSTAAGCRVRVVYIGVGRGIQPGEHFCCNIASREQRLYEQYNSVCLSICNKNVLDNP